MKNKFKITAGILIIFSLMIGGVNASDDRLADARDISSYNSEKELVAYYSFDEGEGNVLHDLSGNGNDGTIYGAKWVDGKYGKALEFDGRNNYVDCGDENFNFNCYHI